MRSLLQGGGLDAPDFEVSKSDFFVVAHNQTVDVSQYRMVVFYFSGQTRIILPDFDLLLFTDSSSSYVMKMTKETAINGRLMYDPETKTLSNPNGTSNGQGGFY